MQESLEASLVRIRTANDRIEGAGFLVGERHILTCAHVVRKALGLAGYPVDPPPGVVSLDFPHIRSSLPGSSCGVPRCPTAVVISQAWNLSANRQPEPRGCVSPQPRMCGNMTSVRSAFLKATMTGCGPPDGCFGGKPLTGSRSRMSKRKASPSDPASVAPRLG
jgi:hypothetical protein